MVRGFDRWRERPNTLASMAAGDDTARAPHAVLDDGLFDICVVGDISPISLVALLPRMYAGTHGSNPAVEFFRWRELVVESPAGPEVRCQADGELLERLPATFSIQPRGLVCVAGTDR